MENKEEAFYESSWFAVLMLCLFFPVGLFVMWKYEKFSKLVRVLVTTGFAIYTVVWILLTVLIFATVASEIEPDNPEVSQSVETKEEPIEEAPTESGNAIADDLLKYVNESAPAIAEQEEEVINLYSSVTGDNYTSDEVTYNTIADEVVPKYRDFIAELELVEVETPELREVHETYIQSVNLQNSGMLILLTALEEQDFEKVSEANDKLSEGRTLAREFQTDLQVLAEENNVVISE